MTGGKVLIIGKTGKNFAAGMSGGVAYVLDEDNDLYLSLNKEMVSSEPVVSKYEDYGNQGKLLPMWLYKL